MSGGSPVIITSGYRCEEHNRAVGSVRNSQHLLGNAADIVVDGVTPKEAATVAKTTVSEATPGLLINVPAFGRLPGFPPDKVAGAAEALGFPGVRRYPNFTHVDVRLSGPARWSEEAGVYPGAINKARTLPAGRPGAL